MRYVFLAIFALQFMMIGSCQQNVKPGEATTINKNIPVTEFEQMLIKNPNATLIDVRTPEEYAGGHLQNAVNIDYNGANFDELIGKLNKNEPVLIYCLSGGRSGSAAKKMKSAGFKEVYNMEGGIMKWNASGKPLGNNNKQTAGEHKGMTVKEFQQSVKTNNYVLVDFNAVWCGPCKKMMPILEKLAINKKDKMTLMKIDADANPDLVREKNIGSIPYLELYNKGVLVWQHVGYIDEKSLLEEIKL